MKIKINNLFFNISFILISFVLVGKVYINSFLKNNYISLFFILIPICLFFITLLKKSFLFKKEQRTFILICLLLILPSFFNNACFNEGTGIISYIFYILICLLGMILVLSNIEKKNLNIFFKIILIFAASTSIITWLSYFFPSFYTESIVTLLPIESQKEVTRMFLYNNAYAGLTDHFSRNAFYVILGIFSCIYFIKNMQNISKKYIILILFFMITLFLIGKRGHLLFLILAFIISYFIFYNVRFKTIIKFLIIALLFVIFIVFGYFFIPGVNNVVNRFYDSGVSNDISTGRFDLYDKAFELYKLNNYSAIGWGQFSKSTNYYYAAVHNDYIQLFIETGLIGFIMIIGSNIYILIKSIKLCRKNKSSLAFIILIYNLFFMLYSITGLPHYDIETLLFYIIINSIMFNKNLEIG